MYTARRQISTSAFNIIELKWKLIRTTKRRTEQDTRISQFFHDIISLKNECINKSIAENLHSYIIYPSLKASPVLIGILNINYNNLLQSLKILISRTFYAIYTILVSLIKN